LSKVWILYRGDELDNAQNFGVFSSEEKANEALKKFSEFEKHLYIEDFEINQLEKYYDKLVEKRQFTLWRHKVVVRADLTLHNEWIVYSPSLDSFIFYAYDDKKSFIYQDKNSVHASVWANSNKEAIIIANDMLEKLGSEEFMYE